MNQIFDRLDRLIKSISNSEPSNSTQGMDPDTFAAYQELEEELGREKKKTKSSHSWDDFQKKNTLSAEIQAAYKTLGLEPGLDFEAVKKAHKFLILKNHPDRFASDPKAYKDATAKTQIINQAFQKIKDHFKTV